MGTYLSKPIVDKESQDEENSVVVCGASSMQGWREAQEDAHSCLLDFDKNISLFAVYDGHGGAEVAQYAAEHLPNMLKNELSDNELYENRDYEKALIEAFLKFDDSLIEPAVIDKLTALRDYSNEAECDELDDDEKEKEEELNELYKEAKIPIEEIIMKYKKRLQKEKDILEFDDQPGSSKESSKSKSADKIEVDDACSSTSNLSVTDEDKKNVANGLDESKSEDNSEVTESSSSTKINGTPKDETNGTEDSGVAEKIESKCGPSSSKEQNGSEKRSSTACLITADSDSDSDTDDDDEMFEAPVNFNDESNSEDSDDILEDDDPILMDEDDDEVAGRDSGCTAVMALLVNNKLYVANAGDSRCVVSIDGKAHDMSKDHKPEDEPELMRISAAGGRVTNDGRVNGGLNLSRALGDHNYKRNDKLPNTEQMITALPDVRVLDLNPENDTFLVLACDGIWNSLSSQEVVDFISERINKPDVKLSSICEQLFDTCLATDTLSDGTGCDNMTCIIVKLKHNQKRSRTEDEGDSSVTAECKKLKLDSTESESIH